MPSPERTEKTAAQTTVPSWSRSTPLAVLAALAAVLWACAPASRGGGGAPSPACEQGAVAASTDRPLWVVLVGHTRSELAQRDVQRRHFSDVVVPAAAAQGARVVVGLVRDDGQRRPLLVADVSLAAHGEAADNPEVAARQQGEATEVLARCLDAALAGPPAERSDPFGSVAWAASLFEQVPAVAHHLVLLGDGVSTTAACNLSGRDLGAGARDGLVTDCVTADLSGLRGAQAWVGGADLAPDAGVAGGVDPTLLEELWAEVFRRHGARLTRYGPTLLATAV